jgi:hypothetical protein
MQPCQASRRTIRGVHQREGGPEGALFEVLKEMLNLEELEVLRKDGTLEQI